MPHSRRHECLPHAVGSTCFACAAAARGRGRPGWETWLFLVSLSLLQPGCAWLQHLRADPMMVSHRLTMQAQLAEDRGDVQEALKLLDRAVRANPDDPGAHRALAQLKLKLGETESAAENLRYLTGQYPDDADAFVQLAQVLIDQQQYVEAQEMLTLALQSNPDHLQGLILMGQLAERRRQYARALEHYHRVLNTDPGNSAAALRIAQLQLQSGRPDCAAPLLRGVYRSREAPASDRVDAGLQLAVAYGQQARWGDVVATLQEVLPQKPDVSADDVYRLAYARFRAGDSEGAYRDAVAALELQQSHGPSQALAVALREPAQTAMLEAVEHLAQRVTAPAGW